MFTRFAIVGLTFHMAGAPAAEPGAMGFTVNELMNLEPSNGVVYFLEKDKSGKWGIAFNERDASREAVEKVYIDLDAKQITLGAPFMDTKGNRQSGGYDRASCAKGRLALKGRADGGKYNVCDSAFTKAAVETGLLTALSAPLTGLLVQTVPYGVVVDKDALATAVAEAGLVERATADREGRKLSAYRSSYAGASRDGATAEQLQRFVDFYTRSGYDPDNVLPGAGVLLEEKRARQAQDAQRIATEQEQRRNEDAVRAEAEARDAVAKSAAEAQRRSEEQKRFRASLKTGDDSNCGLVVEVRTPIAKVQTETGERWLKVERLQPAGGEPCYDPIAVAGSVRSNSSQESGIPPGTRVVRQFSGVTSLGKGACGPLAAPSRDGCSGNVRVSGVVERTSGKRLQIRVASSLLAEDSRLPVPFDSDLGRIEPGSVIWDEAMRWTSMP
ncbi:MAG: hypothetical protein U1F54_15140 [Burkholderiales bacterium]